MLIIGQRSHGGSAPHWPYLVGARSPARRRLAARGQPRRAALACRVAMGATYRIQVIQADRDDWEEALASATEAEIAGIGLHRSVSVEVGPTPPHGEPAVAAYLGSQVAASDATCLAAVTEALADALTVVPVVDDLAAFADHVPASLRPVNGWHWSGPDAPIRLARFLLEELGIEERQRSVFISHKREDGLYAAEQLYDHLGHHGFDPFIDRFDVRAAAGVQAQIADALEERAFLLLLETPLAHTSDWVFDEVDYALTHTMGIHIVRWPGAVVEVPGSSRLPRQTLAPDDLTVVKGYDALTDEGLDRVLAEVESAHATALVRRRRQLLRNVEDAAEAVGLSCTPLPGWRLLVDAAGGHDVVAVTGRLPTVEDLYALDAVRVELTASVGNPNAVLVHSARRLDEHRRSILDWVTGPRPVTLVPENAIGGYW